MFPRITICQGDDGWSQEDLATMGYKDIKNFVIGNNSVERGWRAGQESVKELFDKVYSKPKIEDIILMDILKLNGTSKLNQPLPWKESLMNYEGGRCLELDFPQTNFSLTTIIIKFKDIENVVDEKEDHMHINILITGLD